MSCSRDAKSASRDDIRALFSWKNVVGKVPDCPMNGVNATVGIRPNEFQGDLGNKSKLTTLSRIARQPMQLR
jgi:hypothetical protein